MEVKEAVRVAKECVVELFSGEGIENVGLEEIDLDHGDCWKITIGFPRAWDRNISSVLAGQKSRSYKVVRLSDEDGRIVSITNREESASV